MGFYRQNICKKKKKKDKHFKKYEFLLAWRDKTTLFWFRLKLLLVLLLLGPGR